MNRQFVITVVLFASLLVSGQVLTAAPLGPGFTYQGQLQENGGPAEGPANLRFSLWDAAMDGNQIGASQLVADIPVTNGLFIVTLNEINQFGAEAFNGDERWLQLEDCPDGACAAPEVFLPRQPLTGVPYAHYAASAPWSGLIDVPEGFADNVDNIGDPLWETNGSDISYNAGKVGIGSATPQHRLGISGGPAWTSNGWTGSLELDNAAAIGWRTNTSGRRFGIGQSNGGLFFFNTESDPGTALSPANYAMTINDSGRIGVGAGATNPVYPLTINTGSIGYGLVHTDGIHEVGTFLNASGGWLGTRSDHPLHLFTHDSQPQVTIATTGNVGIGTDTPAGGTKLHVVNTAGYAILGDAPNGNGVVGTNALPGNGATVGINSGQNGVGVFGQADLGVLAIGVFGSSADGIGTHGASTRNVGVKGVSASSSGVEGRSGSSEGVYGYSDSYYGVSGYSTNGVGVYGKSASGDFALTSVGVEGVGYYCGVRAVGTDPNGYALIAEGEGSAARFEGYVSIDGNLSVSETIYNKSSPSTRIDHPLDPANKYLSHSSVQSPDMKNIYDGNVTTDATGHAEITLPDYFEALNKEFRYQLTVIDDAGSEGFVQAKVFKKIEGNQFTIRTSQPNVEVSWQVTGVRQDAYANANPTVVEKEKSESERGKYLTPEVYGQPKEMGIDYRPELERSSETASRGE